ncbi:MAG: hypothetical protein VCB63_02485, partial [Alphaproteobacteria bacterium]
TSDRCRQDHQGHLQSDPLLKKPGMTSSKLLILFRSDFESFDVVPSSFSISTLYSHFVMR